MSWGVLFCEEFGDEYLDLPPDVRREMSASFKLLEDYGPQLGRPYVDSLKGSKYPNMKELRFMAMGNVWRVAFAFDPERRAILLVAGDKCGKNQRRFYRRLIAIADQRFAVHLWCVKLNK